MHLNPFSNLHYFVVCVVLLPPPHSALLAPLLHDCDNYSSTSTIGGSSTRHGRTRYPQRCAMPCSPHVRPVQWLLSPTAWLWSLHPGNIFSSSLSGPKCTFRSSRSCLSSLGPNRTIRARAQIWHPIAAFSHPGWMHVPLAQGNICWSATSIRSEHSKASLLPASTLSNAGCCGDSDSRSVVAGTMATGSIATASAGRSHRVP